MADLPARLGPLPLAVVVTDRAPAGPSAVALQPLGAADTGRLLRHLLDQSGSPHRLAARLAPLCGGIPGYAVEYARAVAADGFPKCGEPPLPARVRGIASARLGRVDERDRAVLGAAAILGDTISAEAVAALLGGDASTARAALARLGGLLVERPGAEYTFADPAVRQVVYARLPRAVRAGHHWRAALRPGIPVARARHWRAASALDRALHGGRAATDESRSGQVGVALGITGPGPGSVRGRGWVSAGPWSVRGRGGWAVLRGAREVEGG
ncbi:hypothetical protein [Phytohabitans houttuyneae]|uniref:Uncharacterized protein n=1 Tax=Phytohabitans houttuyneae TaxID=1076126 RepID=A0A6V8KQK6_9ACTN|nr:hypothetical protein [Phytohabitans houttuyneae]GFJ85680.1 hypothetical protein Phou_098600 [Phytohabitans houttuyneae]